MQEARLAIGKEGFGQTRGLNLLGGRTMGVDFNQVGWFEIPTGDMRRAIRFYESVFDIKLEEHEMGPLQMAWFPMKAGEMGSPGSLVQAKEYTR